MRPTLTGERGTSTDGLPIELDPDADDGGCQDGREDSNANGTRDGHETWNFKASDDRCNTAGNWTLVLTGPPVPGSYGGSDDITCVDGTPIGGPSSVGFNPIGADPVNHVSAVAGDADGDSISVGFAGDIERGGAYSASDRDRSGGHAEIRGISITDGVMHFSMSGTQIIETSEETITRTMLLTVDCPVLLP
jgi:hypothetical protein